MLCCVFYYVSVCKQTVCVCTYVLYFEQKKTFVHFSDTTRSIMVPSPSPSTIYHNRQKTIPHLLHHPTPTSLHTTHTITIQNTQYDTIHNLRQYNTQHTHAHPPHNTQYLSSVGRHSNMTLSLKKTPFFPLSTSRKSSNTRYGSHSNVEQSNAWSLWTRFSGIIRVGCFLSPKTATREKNHTSVVFCVVIATHCVGKSVV